MTRNEPLHYQPWDGCLPRAPRRKCCCTRSHQTSWSAATAFRKGTRSSSSRRHFAIPVFIRQLPEVDNPAADAELVALKPDVYIDYGTVNEDYIASVEAVQKRTGCPESFWMVSCREYRRCTGGWDQLWESPARGNRLADTADALLAKYRGALSSGAPVRVYLACSADGFQPCLADESAGEQLAWLGGVNVAGTRESAPRRPLSHRRNQRSSPHRSSSSAALAGAAARLRENSAGDSRGCFSGARVRVAGAAVYLGRPPSFGQPAAWTRLARQRVHGTPIRPGLRAGHQGLLPRFLPSRPRRRAIAAAASSVRHSRDHTSAERRVIDGVDNAIETFDWASRARGSEY